MLCCSFTIHAVCVCLTWIHVIYGCSNTNSECERQTKWKWMKCLNFQHKFIYFVRCDAIRWHKFCTERKQSSGKTHTHTLEHNFLEAKLIILLFRCVDVIGDIRYQKFCVTRQNGRRNPFHVTHKICFFLVRTILNFILHFYLWVEPFRILIYVQMSNNITYFFDLPKWWPQRCKFWDDKPLWKLSVCACVGRFFIKLRLHMVWICISIKTPALWT